LHRLIVAAVAVVRGVVVDVPGSAIDWGCKLLNERARRIRLRSATPTSRLVICHATAGILLSLGSFSTAATIAATSADGMSVWWTGVGVVVLIRSAVVLLCSWSLDCGDSFDDRSTTSDFGYMWSCGNPLSTMVAGLCGNLDVAETLASLLAQFLSVLVVRVTVVGIEIQAPQECTNLASLLMCVTLLLVAHPLRARREGNDNQIMSLWLGAVIYVFALGATVDVASGQLVEPNLWLYIALGGSSPLVGVVLQCTMALVFAIAWLECSSDESDLTPQGVINSSVPRSPGGADANAGIANDGIADLSMPTDGLAEQGRGEHDSSNVVPTSQFIRTNTQVSASLQQSDSPQVAARPRMSRAKTKGTSGAESDKGGSSFGFGLLLSKLVPPRTARVGPIRTLLRPRGSSASSAR
jgi:hypothetical protein